MDYKQILVVDDENEMRAALKAALTHNGYAVITATDGYDAVEKISENKFDMVITDVKMPEMNGLELLREIKKHSLVTPVVMITAYGTIDSAVEAMKEGAFDYVLKPFSLDSIENIVGRAFSDPPVTVKHKSSRRVSRVPVRDIITRSDKIEDLLDLARNIAESDATVLIQGESGTGKELFARFIHQHSQRDQKPFVAVNCASLPEGLLESELFGYEKGAFTGAVCKKPGKFELANHGTILLDEVSEMPVVLQAKLLRVLQEREIDVVGGREPLPIDVRVIATTNRNFDEEIKNGKFREDLYYRLNVVPLNIPPLRERPDDIPLLARYFLEKHCKKNNKKTVLELSEEVIIFLKTSEWKGNVRELENIMERAVLLCRSGTIQKEHFCIGGSGLRKAKKDENRFAVPGGNERITVREMEKGLIFNTLKEVEGNRTQAARILGISIRTLRNKLNEYKEDASNN